MNIVNTMQPLPIYGSKSEWFSKKRIGNGACRHTLMPMGEIIPFYIHTTDEVDKLSIDVYRHGTDALVGSIEEYYVSITSVFNKVKSVSETIHSYYVATNHTLEDMEGGLYYLQINLLDENDDEVGTLYSDVFKWEQASLLTKIEYFNTRQIQIEDGDIAMFPEGVDSGYVMYPEDGELEYVTVIEGGVTEYVLHTNPLGYAMRMYIRPESGNVIGTWKTEEEQDARDGYEFVEKRVMWKERELTFLANENTVDAVMLVWICDNVKVEKDGEVYNLTYMDAPSVSMSESQNVNEVKIVWRTNTITQVNQ